MAIAEPLLLAFLYFTNAFGGFPLSTSFSLLFFITIVIIIYILIVIIIYILIVIFIYTLIFIIIVIILIAIAVNTTIVLVSEISSILSKPTISNFIQ